MKLAEILDTLSYGPAPEAAWPALDWIAAHQARFQLFIDGKWRDPASHEWFDSVNPATAWRRTEAAKAAATEFVNQQPSNISIGVVAFSDGVTVQPPTNDKAQTLETIYRLVPRRGTSVGNGILVALNTIVVDAGDPPILESSTTPQATPEPAPEIQGWYPSAVIVLLSDGENNQEPDPVLAADLAADLGVRVYTIGVGKPEGAIINVDGFSIMSKLNEGMLQEISTSTGGIYYNADNEEDLLRIYRDLEPKLAFKTEEIEVTALFAGAGFMLFLIAGALSLLWFGLAKPAQAILTGSALFVFHQSTN